MAKDPKPVSSKPAKPPGPTAAEKEAEREKERRNLVETLAGYGMQPVDLGLLLIPPLSAEDVKTRYAEQLELGPAKAKAQLVQGLWQNALKGNASAQIYLHKQMEREDEKRAARQTNPSENPPAETTTRGNVISPGAFHKTFP